MQSYLSGLQNQYQDIAGGAGKATEALGSYFGKTRTIREKGAFWNQAADAGFSLWQGYEEGRAEHEEFAEAAEEYGFEYEKPEGILETWKGVSNETLDKTFARQTEKGWQTMSGKELRNVSDIYKIGGREAVGDIEDYGQGGTFSEAMGDYVYDVAGKNHLSQEQIDKLEATAKYEQNFPAPSQYKNIQSKVDTQMKASGSFDKAKIDYDKARGVYGSEALQEMRARPASEREKLGKVAKPGELLGEDEFEWQRRDPSGNPIGEIETAEYKPMSLWDELIAERNRFSGHGRPRHQVIK